MNGSRSSSPRPGGTSSLDALSRTIEGLEARIEGLMGGGTSRDQRTMDDPRRAAPRDRQEERPMRASAGAPAADPLAEIRQRQRALDGARQPVEPRPIRQRYQEPAPAPRQRQDERAVQPRYEERRPISREPLPPLQPRTPAPRAPQGPSSGEIATREITQALIGLRQDLKKDISEGFSREIATLRTEMRAIKTIAEKRQGAEEFRGDLARLADSIKQLGDRPQDGTAGLRAEFEDLRSLMDGLAREESVQTINSQWNTLGSTLDSRFQAIQPFDIRNDIAALGDRIDAIKNQIGGISDSRSVRVLEEKLIAVANALEQIGSQFDPQERALTSQFQGIDTRLDEISRAIAAGMRSAPSPIDAQVIDRLEDRLASIGHQIDALTDHAMTRDDSWSDPINDLGLRLEALTVRIEDLAHEHAASRLEERIEQLSQLVEETAQRPVEQPELAGYLADISAKIEALDHGAVNERLAERLDHLARRIDELEIPAPVLPAPVFDDRLLRSLEERLDLIAEKLNDTAHAPTGDTATLHGLEEQIAQLSRQLNTVPRTSGGQDDGAVAGRIAALEDYMATSDEYIIEAARQAAEAVMETYSQQARPQTAQGHGDMETLAALANNLKHLEDLSRGTEERTSRTFEALQETLLQIADRLDHIDRPAPAAPFAPPFPPVTTPVAEPAPLFKQTPRPASRESLAEMAQAKIDEQDIVAPISVPWELANAGGPEVESKVSQTELDISVADLLDDTVYETKSEKPSLLAGLGRRLMPGQKKQDQTAERRVQIDPTPSIDPADVLPPEEANELLEPGSGAPDVRKILERVRATQSEQRNRGDAPVLSDGDRTDYIAAARRAAQAAADEMERTPRTAAQGKGIAAEGKGTSLLSRYRRPIMMAIGAILLAAMAMPLVKTLTSGDSAPQAVIESPAPQESSMLPAPAPSEQAAAPIEAPASVENQAAPELPAPPVEESQAMAPPADAPADQGEVLQDVPPAEAATAVEPPVAAEAPVEAAKTEITVPAEITPASLSLAAKDGDPLALFEIAARYTEGRGVSTNLATAAKWYQLSADRGFAPALYRLANLYEKGSGVERNLDTARRYYDMAAAKGNASAMHNLAVLHASGANGTQDYDQAAHWFERAAELGVTDSQFNLAILYARGNGVQQNLETSYKWFAIAARDGDKDAAQKRDEVANSMRPEQLEKARAAVDSWKATPLDVDANAVNPPDEWVGTGVKTASVDMKKAIQNIQAILNRNGYDAGTADGVMGKKTVTAIKAFQTSVGQEATGQVTDDLVKALLARNK